MRERTNLYLSLSLSSCLFHLPPLSFHPLSSCTTIQFDLLPPFPSFVLFYRHPLSTCLSFSPFPWLFQPPFRTLFCFPSRCIGLDFKSPLIFSNFTTILHIEIFPVDSLIVVFQGFYFYFFIRPFKKINLDFTVS